MNRAPPPPPTLPATPCARDRKKDAELADLQPAASAEERAAYDTFVAAAYAQARDAQRRGMKGSPLAIAVRAGLRALRERRRIFGNRPDAK